MILIDTSSLVHFLRRKGHPRVKDRVREILLSGEAALCEMVVVELWMGVASHEDAQDVADLASLVTHLSINEKVWLRAGRLAQECRRKGTPIPSSDLVIAATAFVHDAGLDYEDAHFKTLELLRRSE